MKVILLQNVPRLGQKFEVKEVPDGHAYNFLIPRRLAEAATPAKIAQLERSAHARDAAQDAMSEQLKAFLAKEEKVEIAAPANEQGHLFKGLREGDIAEEIERRAGFPVAVSLEGAIKEVGTYPVAVAAGDARGEVSVSIVAA